MKRIKSKIKSKIRNYFSEIAKIKTSNHEIALGFAVGTFIAVLPTPGFNVLISLFIILTYKKINKIALFLALAIWNPIVLIPIYSLGYSLGSAIFANTPIVAYDVLFIDKIYNFSRRFIVGLGIIGFIMSIGSYIIVRIFLKLINKKKIYEKIKK